MSINWPEKKKCRIHEPQSEYDQGYNTCLEARKKAVSEVQQTICPNCLGGIQCDIHAQPSGLVALDEKKIIESFKQFLEQHTCNWILKQHYVLNATYFKTWIHEICSTFGTPKPRAVVTVKDIDYLIISEARRKFLLQNLPKQYQGDFIEMVADIAQAIFNRLQEEGK